MICIFIIKIYFLIFILIYSIGFANKPKLMSRFLERLEEYKRFWESVSIMCNNYVSGVDHTVNEENDDSKSSRSNSNMETENPSFLRYELTYGIKILKLTITLSYKHNIFHHIVVKILHLYHL